MASLLIDGISELVTNDPTVGDETPLGLVQEAALVVVDDRVAWAGTSARAPDADERLDLGGRSRRSPLGAGKQQCAGGCNGGRSEE